ncbi:hypothetical protein PACTADRAFT_48414 [Pachysolen tannophilus NRRL Y-2460]|uniref:Cyclin-like domain-containing protein n=1 Tax=Pachysolen tannophilus NRRL Y-2460 TaxID=669874 RepID=A0A1E4TXU2_PACTA|nr:hypothetical protein PACTADRAFT_48414 [Pachysolen tannophilus NRRL Y-2460]
MSDSQALSIFLKSPVSQEMLHHLVVSTLHVLPCQSDKNQAYPSPPNSPQREKTLPSLMTFITKLVRYTNVYTGTLMSTAVYLARLRSKLPKDAQGLPCTRHRIFLACLILSAKYHNDSSPKNKHWAKYTDGIFSEADINLMEKQLLYLMNWDLRIEQKELCHYLKRFLDPIKADLKKAIKLRQTIQQKKRASSISHQNQHNITQLPYEYQNQYQSHQEDFSRHLPSPISASSVSSADSIEAIPQLTSTTPRSISRSSSTSVISVVTTPGNYSLEVDVACPTYGESPLSLERQFGVLNSSYVDPMIEKAALHEEQELENLMRQYAGRV